MGVGVLGCWDGSCQTREACRCVDKRTVVKVSFLYLLSQRSCGAVYLC